MFIAYKRDTSLMSRPQGNLGSQSLHDTMNSHTLSLAVVILNLNRAADTVECVESVLKSDYRIGRVIVLDNGSKADDAFRIRAKFGDAIDVLESKRNLGVAAGWNLAIKHAMDTVLSGPRVPVEQ